MRYRGYFYDAETKLYYLQSRYYSPELRRFICGDVGLEILEATVGEIIGSNLFVYCENNCVNNIDADGKFFVGIRIRSDCGLLCLSLYLRGFSNRNRIITIINNFGALTQSRGAFTPFYWGFVVSYEVAG